MGRATADDADRLPFAVLLGVALVATRRPSGTRAGGQES